MYTIQHLQAAAKAAAAAEAASAARAAHEEACSTYTDEDAIADEVQFSQGRPECALTSHHAHHCCAIRPCYSVLKLLQSLCE